MSARIVFVISLFLLIQECWSQQKEVKREKRTLAERMAVRKETYIELDRHLMLYSKILAKNEQPVYWQYPAHFPDSDEMIELPNGTILIGLLDVQSKGFNSNSYTPKYGPLLLMDPDGKKVVWTKERDGWLDSDYNYVASISPNILLTSKVKDQVFFEALNYETGQPIWKYTVKEDDHDFIVLHKNESLILLTRQGSNGQLQSLNLGTGKVQWESKLGTASGSIYMFNFGNGFGVLHDALELFDGNGSSIGHFNIPSYESFFTTEKGIVLLDSTGVNYVNFDSGNTTRISIEEPTSMFDETGSHFIFGHIGDSPGIKFIDKLSGSIDWTIEESRKVYGLTTSNERLIYTTQRSINFVDLKTKISKKIEFPESMPAVRPMDILIERGNRIIFGTESGVGSFDPEVDTAVWFHKFLGGQLKSMRYYELLRTNYEKALGELRGKGGTIILPLPNSRQKNWFLMQAERRVMETRKKGGTEYIAALEHRANLLKIDHAFQKINTEINLWFATYELAEQFSKAAEASQMRAGYHRANTCYLLYKKMHLNSVTNKYFIRPIEWKYGRGLVVIDIETGRWAEIPVSPTEDYLGDVVFMDIQSSLLPSGNNVLVTTGIGLNSDSWERDERERAATVHRSIIFYDFKNIEFREAQEYPTGSMVKF